MSCQAAHTILLVFWVPDEEPLGGTSLTAKRHMCANPVSGFLMNCLAAMITYQATRVNLARF